MKHKNKIIKITLNLILVEAVPFRGGISFFGDGCNAFITGVEFDFSILVTDVEIKVDEVDVDVNEDVVDVDDDLLLKYLW